MSQRKSMRRKIFSMTAAVICGIVVSYSLQQVFLIVIICAAAAVSVFWKVERKQKRFLLLLLCCFLTGNLLLSIEDNKAKCSAFSQNPGPQRQISGNI